MGWCCGFSALIVVWVALVAWRETGRRSIERRLKEQGAAPFRPPDAAELTTHLPRDEAALRGANLGDDVERIVQLFAQGRFASATILEHGMTETPISANAVSVATWIEYGWYDDRGSLQRRRTGVATDRLLNRQLDWVSQRPFVVAWDPQSKDHVAFLALGVEASPLALAPPKPWLPPPIVQVHAPLAPAMLARIDTLEATILERLDDSVALGVISDRLIELGSTRGELLALQLARGIGGQPNPREVELIDQLRPSLTPPGSVALGFELSVAWRVELEGSTDWRDARWRGVHSLIFGGDESAVALASAELPNLSSLQVPRVLRPKAAQRLVPKLTSLELGALDDVWVRALRVQLARAPRLRRLAIMRAQSFALLVEAVLQDAKSLERLEVREVLITAQELVRAQRALAKASSTLVVELGPFGSPDLSVVFTRDDAELCGTPRASARSKLEGQRLLSELERLKRGA